MASPRSQSRNAKRFTERTCYQTDPRLNSLPRLAVCFLDGRKQEQVEHSMQEMPAQRIHEPASGYEDLTCSCPSLYESR